MVFSKTLHSHLKGNKLSTVGNKVMMANRNFYTALNIYLSIRIDHAPSKATKMVAYQCIITLASTQYPPTAWLNHDVHFCTLAASDPNLHTLGCLPYRPVASMYISQIHTLNILALYTV